VSDGVLLAAVAAGGAILGYGFAWLEGLVSEAPFNRGAARVIEVIRDLNLGDDIIAAIEAEMVSGDEHARTP
jgi:hypothetical protein